MFFLHSSNKTENLLEHLLAVMAAAPLSSPFSQEVFLIQSQGMERWLAQQMASRLQLWANDRFLFPGKFFSDIAARLDSRLNDAALDRHVLLWRFEALLRDIDAPVYQPLQQYLQGGNVALKRFQLAQQLAKVFDQYQIMRPDMLSRWQQGEYVFDNQVTERWQRELWFAVTKLIGTKHRGSLWLDSIETLRSHLPGHFAEQLPERICLFGVNTLPPLFLAYLQALSQHCDLHLFLLNPSQTFWADLETKRQRAKAGIASTFTGHPLLVSLGQQGREFQDMLLSQTQFSLELDSFEPTPATTLLQQLQNDILDNQLSGVTPFADYSISVHACHSRMREVEVLKNLLLQQLEHDPTLELRDMVVMAPDIQDYEPFITAVFSDIQHAIADRSLRLSNAALDAFIRFLQVSQSRFAWQAVVDLLEHPAVYPCFDLTADDLVLVRHWIQATQVRWGKSAQQKRGLGLPAIAQNTWQAALDRLLMGYGVGSEAAFVDGVLPFSAIEGASAQALGGLYDFLQLLFSASESLQQPKPFTEWHQQLQAYAQGLLHAAEPLERQALHDLLDELLLTLAPVHAEAIEISVMISWFETRVSEQKSTNGFLRGQLTFCSMLPMRSIPFRVIALLGMNEGEFPKIDRQPSFDLLQGDFRKGDRSSRADDRYQFLEILLSARQQLFITYLGQSIAHNEAIPPSVVVSELLDVLRDAYQRTDLVTVHPLQAFSARYFTGDAALVSYAAVDCATAVALAQPKQPPFPWWQGVLAVQPEDLIEVRDLQAYFRHPQRFFVRRQLDVRFQASTAEVEAREPFSMDALDNYTIAHTWIEAQLQQQPFPLAKLQAQGNWLSGAYGLLAFEQQAQAINTFVARIQAKQLGARLPDMPVDIRLGHFRLVGMSTQQYEHGSLFYRYAPLKGKDLVCAWLQHLWMNQVRPQVTYVLSVDTECVFLPEQADAAQLMAWLQVYQQGLLRPDAFFVEAAFAYVKQVVVLQRSKTATVSPLQSALSVLTEALMRAYEAELRCLYREPAELSAVLGDEFVTLCETLLQPVWDWQSVDEPVDV